MSPRRIYINEAIYFTTHITKHRFPFFLDKENCKIVLDTIDFYKKRNNLSLTGIEFLPCHIHNIQYIKQATLNNLFKWIKNYSSRLIRKRLKNKTNLNKLVNLSNQFICGIHCKCQSYNNEHAPNHIKRFSRQDLINVLSTGNTWHKSFYDHVVRSEKDYTTKIYYTIHNHIKHKYKPKFKLNIKYDDIEF